MMRANMACESKALALRRASCDLRVGVYVCGVSDAVQRFQCGLPVVLFA
jgi:hypothetical protein